jgi:hypothetical protein
MTVRLVRARGLTATLLLAVVGCASPAASPSDSSQPSAIASPTVAPTPAPSPSKEASAPTPSAPAEHGWIELTAAPIPFLHDVTSAPWGWLGVGMAAESTDTEQVPATWRSSDGLTWEDRSYQLPTEPAGVVEALYQVEETVDGFAALGSPWYGIAVSEDGVAWTYETLGEGACPAAITANDEVLVAVGSIGPCGMGGGPGTPAIWVRDAEGWTLLDAPVSTGWFTGVVATPQGFTAWGSVTESADSWTCQIGCTPDLTLEPFANAPWSSPDGWTWARASDSSPFVGASIGSVASTDDVLVALGSVLDPSGGPAPIAVWTSSDGDAWSMVDADLPFADADQIASPGIGGGGALVAVWVRQLGEVPSTTLFTSSDGEQWEGEATIVTDLRGVSQLGDGLIAYGTVPRSGDGSQEPCDKDEVLAGTCRNVAAAWVYAAEP